MAACAPPILNAFAPAPTRKIHCRTSREETGKEPALERKTRTKRQTASGQMTMLM